MENKITFFRLSYSNSNNHFDNDKKVLDSDLRQLKYLREEIYKFSEKKHTPLSKKELDLFQIIVSIRKEIVDKREDYKFVPKPLFCDLTSRPSPENLETKIYKDFYKRVYEETKLGIEEVTELLSQEIYNNDYYKLKEKIETINKKTDTERIHIEDLDKINLVTKEMNNDGWKIKQIEGIQTGISDYGFGHKSVYGYGYGFTDGVLIVWEK